MSYFCDTDFKEIFVRALDTEKLYLEWYRVNVYDFIGYNGHVCGVE